MLESEFTMCKIRHKYLLEVPIVLIFDHMFTKETGDWWVLMTGVSIPSKVDFSVAHDRVNNNQ